jgi:hypothetical protein
VPDSTATATAVAPGHLDLHRSPPVTLRAVRQHGPWLAPAALTLFIVLGVAAAIHGGAALVWDGPITKRLRRPAVDRAARWATRLGSTPVVLAAGAAGVALSARRCRSVAPTLGDSRPRADCCQADLVVPCAAIVSNGSGPPAPFKRSRFKVGA